MFATLIDLIFGSYVKGIKTEITVAVTAGLNFVSALLHAFGYPSIPADTLTMLNTLLLGAAGMFLGSRVTRVEQAATIAATAPTVVHVSTDPAVPATQPAKPEAPVGGKLGPWDHDV